MDRNKETTDIRSQEDQAMSPLIAFDKEKLSAMQKYVLEGIIQYGNSQHCSLPGQINKVEDVLPSLSCKGCYPRCPRSHTLVKE